MKGGVYNSPECCNQPCQCPVCLEDKLLMRLNCNHYVCLDDITGIINRSPSGNRRCPVCRTLMTSYECNGDITHIGNDTTQNVRNRPQYILSDDDSDSDIVGDPSQYFPLDYYSDNDIVGDPSQYILSDDEDEMTGGKNKTKKRKSKSKTKSKTKKSKRKTKSKTKSKVSRKPKIKSSRKTKKRVKK